MTQPTIGRVVIYRTTESDQEKMRIEPNCNVAEELPAVIVAVHGTGKDPAVNLNVQLDGEGSLWATSVHQGSKEGEYYFPEIVKQQKPKNEPAPAADKPKESEPKK